MGYLHKFLSRYSWAQELGKVGKLLPLELLMKLFDELQILGTEARHQAVLHLQALEASCTRPACQRTTLCWCSAMPRSEYILNEVIYHHCHLKREESTGALLQAIATDPAGVPNVHQMSSSDLETQAKGVHLLPDMRKVAVSAPSDTELASTWSRNRAFLSSAAPPAQGR